MSRLLRLFLLASVAALAACRPAPTPPPIEPLESSILLEQPAEQAWAQIQALPETERQALQLTLLEQWAERSQWEAVTRYLPQINTEPLDEAERNRLRFTHAQAQYHYDDLNGALAQLLNLPASVAVLRLRIRVHDRLRHTGEAARARLLLATFPAASERQTLTQNAWNTLLAQPTDTLQTWRKESRHDLWRGWLDLALLARPRNRPQVSIRDTLNEWQARYPQHPAHGWLAQVEETLQDLYTTVQSVAVLIPVTGDLAAVGQAIRAGIELRLQQSDPAPSLRIYDTGDPNSSPEDLYWQATHDGAELIIGPFNKSSVARLTHQDGAFIDTISLNYLEGEQTAPPAFYQFGLLPEDEAHQVAERAWAEQHRSAVVLVPSSGWGQRILKAFTKRFEALGGTIAASAHYFPRESDHTVPIKTILNLADSEHRHQELEEVLGHEVIARPTRRQDIDMVFLVASPHTARLLKPQLDFYYADDLPVYATSHIYTGVPSPLKDRDLNGIRFCDIPMVLDATLQRHLARTEVASRQPRFTALGADAFLLATNLAYLKNRPGVTLNGWTGTLSLDAKQRVFRRLPWAEFRGGQAVPLQDPAPVNSP